MMKKNAEQRGAFDVVLYADTLVVAINLILILYLTLMLPVIPLFFLFIQKQLAGYYFSFPFSFFFNLLFKYLILIFLFFK